MQIKPSAPVFLTTSQSLSVSSLQHDKAVKLLSAAVSQSPTSAIAWFSLAVANGRKGCQDTSAVSYLGAYHLLIQSTDPKVSHGTPVGMPSLATVQRPITRMRCSELL